MALLDAVTVIALLSLVLPGERLEMVRLPETDTLTVGLTVKDIGVVLWYSNAEVGLMKLFVKSMFNKPKSIIVELKSMFLFLSVKCGNILL